MSAATTRKKETKATSVTDAHRRDAIDAHNQAEHLKSEQGKLGRLKFEYYKRAGTSLILAQRRIPYGSWGHWLTGLPFSQDTAENYMKVAYHWDSLEPLIAANSLVSLRQALKKLKDEKAVGYGTSTAAKLLEQLHSVQAGLSERNILEQTADFIFKDKQVYTYNEQVACSRDCCLDIEGAIHPDSLLPLLKEIAGENPTFEEKEDKLEIQGDSWTAHVPLAKKIINQLEVEPPEEWKPLPFGFVDALKMVCPCAAAPDKHESIQHVEFSKEGMQACDTQQAIRYRIPLDIEKSFLVRGDDLAKVARLSVKEMSETKNWVHFKTTEGLTVSCKRKKWKYPAEEVEEAFQQKTKPFSWPSKAKRALKRASVLLKAEDIKEVAITMEPDCLTIRAKGILGVYEERFKGKFKVEASTFKLPPEKLNKLMDQKCRIGKTILKVETASFTYIVATSVPKKDEKEKRENGTKKKSKKEVAATCK